MDDAAIDAKGLAPLKPELERIAALQNKAELTGLLDFVNSALDWRDPGKFIGPNSLDRTHQLSAGVVMELPKGFQMDFISHWATALPQTITFAANSVPEDILQTDTVGDGQAGVAPIPGTQVGSFGRGIKVDGLNNALTKYSDTFGNQLTPAGQALVAAGLFTQDQLTTLCAVTPSLNPPPGCAAQYGNLQVPTALADKLATVHSSPST